MMPLDVVIVEPSTLSHRHVPPRGDIESCSGEQDSRPAPTSTHYIARAGAGLVGRDGHHGHRAILTSSTKK